jgi:dephospho-CoA kinase
VEVAVKGQDIGMEEVQQTVLVAVVVETELALLRLGERLERMVQQEVLVQQRLTQTMRVLVVGVLELLEEMLEREIQLVVLVVLAPQVQ